MPKTPGMRTIGTLLIAVGCLAANTVRAQWPTAAEWDTAVQGLQVQAAQAGLGLQGGSLWRQALQRRTPLVSAYGHGVCHLGFSPYTPGADYAWLFPRLPPDERALWLGGALQHELAHCAEQAGQPGQAAAALPLALGGSAATPAMAPQARWQAEVLADLAFALHMDADPSAPGARLVGLLAQLRAAQAARDPDHDTSPVLQCYLAWRGRFRPEGAWMARLQAWRGHCLPSPTASDAPIAAADASPPAWR